MATKIDPIFLTQDAAVMLAATVDLTSALVQRAVDGETTTEQSIPARLTAYHASTDASNPTGFNFYDWTRQMYDPTGKRVDFIPTQTGGLNVPTAGNVFSPAIPIGTNTRVLQPSEFPCEVMLDKRNANAKYGPVYEFTMPGAGAPTTGLMKFIQSNTASNTVIDGVGGIATVNASLGAGDYLISVWGNLIGSTSSEVVASITLSPPGEPLGIAYAYCRPVPNSSAITVGGFGSGSFTNRLHLFSTTPVSASITGITSATNFGSTHTNVISWAIWQYG